MAFLDLNTIFVVYIGGNLICAIVLFTLWRENRSRYTGMEFWMGSFICDFVGIALIAGRGTIPNFLSSMVGPVSLVLGTFILYHGLEVFLRNRRAPMHLYFLLGLFIFLQAYFIYISPSILGTIILFSSSRILFSIQFAWLLFWKVDPETRKVTRNLGIVTSIFGVLGVFRIFSNLIVPPGSDLFRSSGFEALVYLVFQMLNIVLTIFLFVTVNRRLFFDLEKDSIERKQAEDALQISQDKYAKAFKASPNPVLISRINDGQIIEANDVFMDMTGYSQQEIFANTTLKLGIWVNPSDRDEVVTEMHKNSRIRNFQFDLRAKNNSILRAELSAEYIKLGGEECMIVVIRDVSEQKRMDGILHLRLKLWEFSISHNAMEVMLKALDEIESITGSQIGFYHLVEEDSNSLMLQVWSTRTSTEFCHAEGSGMHYSIDQAGVWVDCIRERRPVIHNDYAAVPNKKGMPEGHATVIRELVVPIIENDQIVSILGVGNKPTNYDNKDVELVEYMASLVWSIVAQKRADEKIHQLNEQLEKLAMTDELTSLPNRRSFFLRGNEEMNRSRRYHEPLSLIILDIDRFKNINDSYGHDVGDLALQCFAKTIREQIREVDIPARLGGEEFAILLPNTKLEDGIILAERVRKSIEALQCLMQDKPVAITASLGIAAFEDGMKNLDDLFHNADAAMYLAKNQGRNRVVKYDNSEQLIQ